MHYGYQSRNLGLACRHEHQDQCLRSDVGKFRQLKVEVEAPTLHLDALPSCTVRGTWARLQSLDWTGGLDWWHFCARAHSAKVVHGNYATIHSLPSALCGGVFGRLSD